MYTEDQIQLIKNTVARGATDDELKLFLHWCEASGFDPLRRQAHFSIRKTKCPTCKGTAKVDGLPCTTCEKGYLRTPTFIPGIDGLLSRAGEHPNYMGVIGWAVHENDDFAFDAKESLPVRHIFFSKDRGKIIGAWATVHFRDGRKPFSVWYPMAEYLTVAGPISEGMPELQLVKSAYSIALRRAFPDKFSGAYSAEEFGGRIDEATGMLVLPPRAEPEKLTTEETIAKYSGDNGKEGEFTEGVLTYRKTGEKLEVLLNGKWLPAKARVGRVKDESMVTLLGYFSHDNHLRNHLKKHFKVGEVAALTWEELAALIAKARDNQADPRWYEEKTNPPSLETAYHVPPNTHDDEIEEFYVNVLKLPDPLCLAVLFDPPHNWTWKSHRQALVNLGTLLATEHSPLVFDTPEFWELVKAAETESVPA